MQDELALLGRLKTYQFRIEKSRRIINAALEIPARWGVSFSGGKDSTVLLDLVLKEKPELEIVWFDDGWDYPETIQFLASTENRLRKHIIRVPYPLQSQFWKKEANYGGDDPTYSHNFDMTYKDWRGAFMGSFMGMRRDESSRRDFVLKKSPLYFQKTLGHWHCSPLAEWTAKDIWGYIAANDLPFNPVYRKLYSLGVALDEMRVGPLTAWMVWQYGALVYIKRGWPDLFNRFAAQFPEARSYV